MLCTHDLNLLWIFRLIVIKFPQQRNKIKNIQKWNFSMISEMGDNIFEKFMIWLIIL